MKIDEATIRQKAYHLWGLAGRPAGREQEFGDNAETRLHEK